MDGLDIESGADVAEGVVGVEKPGVDDGEELVVDVDMDGRDEIDALPFAWPMVTGTDPKDFTTSDFIAGVTTGEEDIGALSSFIEPNVTGEAPIDED